MQREFKEFSSTVGEGDEKRKTTVRAHVVTDKTRGRVVTTSGPVDVEPGQVLVMGDNANVFDVLTSDAWKETGYGKTSTGNK